MTIAAQPGIKALVLAAHEKGTRDDGAMSLVWSVYDRRAMLLSLLAVGAVIVFVARRRRLKRKA